MIYYDPTEDRARSTMPVELIKQARELGNLEKHTGADLLITPHERPLPKAIQDIPPHMIALERACQDGCLLQVKRGNDLLSSIADLESILARMKVWTPQYWLVVTRVTHRGEKVKVDGKQAHGSMPWASIQGAYNAWRLRGGSVASELATDQELVSFAAMLDNKLGEYYRDPEKAVAQKGHVQSVKLIDRNWHNTLSAWPTGIGKNMLFLVAQAITKRGYEPSLYNVARFILSGQADLIKGWGHKSTQKCRSWWGYREKSGAVDVVKFDSI